MGLFGRSQQGGGEGRYVTHNDREPRLPDCPRLKDTAPVARELAPAGLRSSPRHKHIALLEPAHSPSEPSFTPA